MAETYERYADAPPAGPFWTVALQPANYAAYSAVAAASKDEIKKMVEAAIIRHAAALKARRAKEV